MISKSKLIIFRKKVKKIDSLISAVDKKGESVEQTDDNKEILERVKNLVSKKN